MKYLISAIQFITILPIGKPGTFAPEGMASFFPIVGLMLGILLALFDAFVSNFWSVPVASVLDCVFMVWITGAFHLDGLGDTADGLYGNRPKERALEIMKDSRIGAMALVMVICVLAMKWGGMTELKTHRALFLILIPAYSRAGMLFGFYFLPYGRSVGTGHALFEKPLDLSQFWSLGILIGLSLFCGWRGILLNGAFFLITAGILLFYKKRMGCITGDMLGAMTELTEAGLFLTAAIGGGI